MKKFDYRLAQERVKLATDMVKLGRISIKFIIELLGLILLLSMAFNYSSCSGYQIASPQMAK